jgi:uncharacterized RDD family membrane protein YckC
MIAPAEKLEIATPERVAMELPLAGVGSRALAYLIDAGAMFVTWVVAYFVLSLIVSDVLGLFQSLSGLAQSLLAIGLFAAQWVYWTACEALWGGRTLGKRAVGIRVSRQDGEAPGVFECAVRNLCRVLDFLPVFYCAGVIAALLGRRHQRLGDLLAGTVLVREEAVDLSRYAPGAEAGPAPSPAARAHAALTPAETELVLAFLDRAPSLEPAARARLTGKMVERFLAHRPPEERARLGASFQLAELDLRRRAQGA